MQGLRESGSTKRTNTAILLILSLLLIACLPSCVSMDREIPAIRVSATEHPRIFKLNISPRRGYSYDAYIWIPYGIQVNRLLVISNNTGTTHDSLNYHDKDAFRRMLENGWEKRIAKNLNTPLLMPVFPRPSSDSYKDYHSLNRLALFETGRTRRIDHQLIAMIKNVQEYLKSSHDIQLDEKILMTGYSSSGNFVNRFTMLHPEIVHAVAAGGTAGNLMLPLEEYGGEEITFPLGIADYKEITGHEFDFGTWGKVHQYLYNGALDINEYYAGTDALNDPTGQDRQVHKLFGSNLVERFPKTAAVYNEYTDNCQIVLYHEFGHEPTTRDVVEFFRKNSGDEFVPIEPLFPSTNM